MEYIEGLKVYNKILENGMSGADLKPLKQAAIIVIETEIENMIMNVYDYLNEDQEDMIQDFYERITNTIEILNYRNIDEFDSMRSWCIKETQKKIQEIIK